MYIPKKFVEKDKSLIVDFITHNSFGILISVADNLPVGSHIPLVPEIGEGDKLFLHGHISKGNSQKTTLYDGAKVLVIFAGPHAYISPRWYTELNVPTWNYVSVHIYGTIRLIEGEELKRSLDKVVDFYEASMPHPMKMKEIPEKTFNEDFRGIIGFVIEVDEIQAASKLSQNRDDQSYNQIISELDNSSDQAAQKLAAAMKHKRPSNQ